MKTMFRVILPLLALLASAAHAAPYDKTSYAGNCAATSHTGLSIEAQMKKEAANYAKSTCAPYGVQQTVFTTFPMANACRLSGPITCSTTLAPTTASTSTSTPEQMIQNCPIVSLKSLGYSSGSQHHYCLNKGWNGGHISGRDYGFCWKTPTGDPTKDCSRLNSYYQKTGGMDCPHLTDADAKMLRVCSHK